MLEKKIRKPPNATKVQSHVMLILHNVWMVPLNVRKNKKTTKYDKGTITCGVGTAQCEDCIIKCEEKNKGTIECDKSTVTRDVGIAQCENGTIECEKKKKRNYQM